MPALPTLEDIPHALEKRAAELVRGVLQLHVDTEKTARRPGFELTNSVARASRWVWLAPALLLRRPPHNDSTDSKAESTSLTKTLRRRMQLAEAEKWEQLLIEYVGELREAQVAASGGPEPHAAQTDEEDLATFRRVAAKMRGQCTRAAKALLGGARKAPLDEHTAEAIEKLVCVPVSPEENQKQQQELRRAMSCVGAVGTLRQSTTRRRLRTLARGAQPGPSGWRNHYLQMVGRTDKGVHVLTRWAEMWCRGHVVDESVRLWKAAIIAPVDCGEAVVAPEEEPHRKLRPIALAEALLKLTEGVAIDEAVPTIKCALEPRQLGCNTADGAPLTVRVLRSWAEDMARAAEDGSDIADDGLSGLDLENAYGRAHRSSCLQGAQEHAPALAPLAATQWRLQSTNVWQRVNGT